MAESGESPAGSATFAEKNKLVSFYILIFNNWSRSHSFPCVFSAPKQTTEKMTKKKKEKNIRIEEFRKTTVIPHKV